MSAKAMLQIRNMPVELHRKLKVRAAEEGVSMSEFALRTVKQALDRPTREEMMARLRALPPVELNPSAAEMIRADRDSR